MDTTWFAVDRDGYVAEFYSGESGAVPSGAASDAHGITYDLVAASLPETVLLHDPAPGRQPGVPHADAHRIFWNDDDRELDNVLTIVTGPEVVAAEVARGEAFPAPAAEGYACLWRTLPRAVYERLHAAGDCLYCSYIYVPEGFSPETGPGTCRGLFGYAHPSLGMVARAYARGSQPQVPVTLDQLPETVRDAVGRLRFSNLSFRETAFIQPVELVPECLARVSIYLDTEGKILRAIPGDEDLFPELLAELREHYPEFAIEPPDPPAQE